LKDKPINRKKEHYESVYKHYLPSQKKYGENSLYKICYSCSLSFSL
jgi:hypothetical protein